MFTISKVDKDIIFIMPEAVTDCKKIFFACLCKHSNRDYQSIPTKRQDAIAEKIRL